MTKLWQNADKIGCGRKPPIAQVRSAVSQFGSGSGRYDPTDLLTVAKPQAAPQPTVPPTASPAARHVVRQVSGHICVPETHQERMVPVEIQMLAAERYSRTPDYGRKVVGGWGETKRVRVGVPFVNKFSEVVVVYRPDPEEHAGSTFRSTSLGSVPK